MNIIKLIEPIIEQGNVTINTIMTDAPIWFNMADLNVFIKVAYTGTLRIVQLSNIMYVCPVDMYTGE